MPLSMLPESDNHRLFFGLWPEEALRQQIAERTRAAVIESGGRSIPPRNYHITLLFIGNVGRAGLDRAQAVAAALSSPAFELSLDHIHSPARARVMWLGTQQQPPALATLVRALHSSELASGIEHRFKPHLTLVRDPIRRPRTLTIEPVTWPARDFVLVRSHLGAVGSEYSVIGRWALV
jgi:RNA 2',3'-cyclic 3'-phosphodiesterase